LKTICPHSHADREGIIKEMIPYVKNKFGDNLVALAACCSYARFDDADYSDLELTAFVKEMPTDKSRDGVAKIYKGLLIELLWMTRETYLRTTLDVNEYWHYSGADTLLPILNEEFVNEISAYRPRALKGKCLDQAIGCFTEVQEAVSKVLNAVNQDNHQGMPLLFFDMLNQILRTLSFVNQTPFTTASMIIAQARQFPVQPEHFSTLLDSAVAGHYQDFGKLKDLTVTVFGELEMLFDKLGLPLMDDNLDPDQPVHEMRKMQ
jgi:hypothetical protein